MFKTDKEELKAILAYISVCTIWGSTYLAMRIAVKTFPPELFAGIRFTLAGSMMLLFAYFKRYKFPGSLIDVGKNSLIGLLLITASNGLVIWALQWVDSGITCVFLAAIPLFIGVIEILLPSGSKIGLKGWLGLLVGFGGVIMLVFYDSRDASFNILGVTALIIASMTWATGSVYSKYTKSSGSIISTLGIQMLAGGLGQTLAGILLGEIPDIHFSLSTVWPMLYLVFIGSFLGYGSYIYLLQKWPATKVGTYAYVNPVVAVILGFIILGEPVHISTIVSAAIILSGVLIVQLSKSSKIIKSNHIEA